MSHGPLAAYSAYANDINIHSDTWGEHVQQVPTVLEYLRQAGLTSNPKKF